MAPPPIPTDPRRLRGRVAFITGSSGRLGRAISILFAAHGANLFLVDKYRQPRNPMNASTGKADDWETRWDASKHDDSNAQTSTAQQQTSAQRDMYIPTDEYIRHHYGSGGGGGGGENSSNDQIGVHFHETDLTSEPQVQSAIAACVSTYKRIDILINAHGISVESTHPSPLPIHSTPLADYTLTMSINSTSLFLTMKHFLAQVVDSGLQTQKYEAGRAWIVNVASVQASTPFYGTPSYCASKGAALMLTRQVALDYAVVGVRCNAVCPGFLDSDMTRNLQGDVAMLRGVSERHPLRVGSVGGGKDADGKWQDGVRPAMGPGKGGLGDVEDVARAVLVLAGDDARWMTGQGVVVDGGYSIS